MRLLPGNRMRHKTVSVFGGGADDAQRRCPKGKTILKAHRKGHWHFSDTCRDKSGGFCARLPLKRPGIALRNEHTLQGRPKPCRVISAIMCMESRRKRETSAGEVDDTSGNDCGKFDIRDLGLRNTYLFSLNRCPA